MPESMSKLEQQRYEKLQKLRSLGVDPYGQKFDNIESAKNVKQNFSEDKK